jgi:N-acetylglucosaminyldiphosphoundecaprenol N-acetyl-beta-D-mannosaminyltransferase
LRFYHDVFSLRKLDEFRCRRSSAIEQGGIKCFGCMMTGRLQSRLRTLPVLGTPLLVTTYAELIAECQRLVPLPGSSAIEFVNTHIVTKRRAEPDFRGMTDAYDYFVPDGMPLIWCLNRQGAGMSDRVYGPLFMRQCLLANPKPMRHYLLGGSPELGTQLREVLQSWDSGTEIVGSFHGEFDHKGELKTGSDEDLLRKINDVSPDYIWVGLGTPKQQAWIARNKGRVQRGVIFGVGFGFDVNAGCKPDAPMWMQRRGLTWLFRLVSEPRRLTGRYLKYNSLFMMYLLLDAVRAKDSKKASA